MKAISIKMIIAASISIKEEIEAEIKDALAQLVTLA